MLIKNSKRRSRFQLGRGNLLSGLVYHVPILSISTTSREGRDDARCGDPEQEPDRKESSRGAKREGERTETESERTRAGHEIRSVEGVTRRYDGRRRDKALVEGLVIDMYDIFKSQKGTPRREDLSNRIGSSH